MVVTYSCLPADNSKQNERKTYYKQYSPNILPDTISSSIFSRLLYVFISVTVDYVIFFFYLNSLQLEFARLFGAFFLSYQKRSLFLLVQLGIKKKLERDAKSITGMCFLAEMFSAIDFVLQRENCSNSVDAILILISVVPCPNHIILLYTCHAYCWYALKKVTGCSCMCKPIFKQLNTLHVLLVLIGYAIYDII